MAKNSPLEKYTVKQVDEIIRKSRNIKDAAKKMGISAQELYMYRSRNMKEFNRIKAEREQGLIMDEETIEETIKKEPIVIDVEKQKADMQDQINENQKLKESLKEVEQKQLDAKDEYDRKIASYKSKITELENRNIELVNEKQETIRKADNKPNLEIQALKNELAQKNTMLQEHQNTINKAAETNKIIRAELEKQEAQNIDLVAENGEVKRQLKLKDEMYQNAMNEVKRLDEKNKNITKIEEDNKVTNQALTLVKMRNTKLEEQIEELHKQIEGYQEEIHNMTQTLCLYLLIWGSYQWNLHSTKTMHTNTITN